MSAFFRDAPNPSLEPLLAKLRSEGEPQLDMKAGTVHVRDAKEVRDELTALKRWPWLSATALCEADATGTAAQSGGAWERHTEFHKEHTDEGKVSSGFDYAYFLVQHPLPPLEGQVSTLYSPTLALALYSPNPNPNIFITLSPTLTMGRSSLPLMARTTPTRPTRCGLPSS